MHTVGGDHKSKCDTEQSARAHPSAVEVLLPRIRASSPIRTNKAAQSKQFFHAPDCLCTVP